MTNVLKSLKDVQREIDWTPKYSYSTRAKEDVFYPKMWFCQSTMQAHSNLMDKVNCPHCSTLTKEERKKAKKMIKN